MASGYTDCQCCGYPTVSDDETKPELCSDCIDAECDPDGSEPGGPDCPGWPEESEGDVR